MRTTLKMFLGLALMFVSYSTNAQEAQKIPKPGFFVLHQNKVRLENLAKLNALQDSIFVPILNELVEEGKLIGWGQLIHAWGDEWNYNYYFTTENHRAFLDFWGEFFSRVNKRFPGWSDRFGPLITDHKDNMYSIRSMR